jgi:hypothetical protein
VGFLAIGGVATIVAAILLAEIGLSGRAIPAGAAAEPTATTALGTRPDATVAAVSPAGIPRAAHAGGTELYGYLPYWQMSATMADYLRNVSLTSLELFSVSANRTGTINRGQSGYTRITGAIGARLIAEAHGRGQRVELVFSSFGFARNTALFGASMLPSFDPRLRLPLDAIEPPKVEMARTVQGLVSLVSRLGLDGINVDAEQVSPAAYDGFSAFITALRDGLDRVNPALHLSAATMASQAGANLARVALDAGAGRVFLMGYDFHWSGSEPGGTTPVERLDGGASLTSAMATYAATGIPADRILLGLPLYGMAWPVASADRYAPRIGPGQAWLPSKHLAQLTAPGFVPHLDPLEISEYLSERLPPSAADPLGSETWRAVFYDSPRTLRAKLALARAAGYAGGGFWALGYERGVPGYTDLMTDFVEGRVAAAPAAEPAPAPGPADPRRPPTCVARC